MKKVLTIIALGIVLISCNTKKVFPESGREVIYDREIILLSINGYDVKSLVKECSMDEIDSLIKKLESCNISN